MGSFQNTKKVAEGIHLITETISHLESRVNATKDTLSLLARLKQYIKNK